jgi:hypothetical protein
MHGAGERAVAADQLKDGKAVLVANNRLAIDQTGPDRQRLDRMPCLPPRNRAWSRLGDEFIDD